MTTLKYDSYYSYLITNPTTDSIHFYTTHTAYFKLKMVTFIWDLPRRKVENSSEFKNYCNKLNLSFTIQKTTRTLWDHLLHLGILILYLFFMYKDSLTFRLHGSLNIDTREKGSVDVSF